MTVISSSTPAVAWPRHDKRKAGRASKENAGQVDPQNDKRRSNVIVAKKLGESVKQMRRFIRLTELIPPLPDMVDAGKIALNPALYHFRRTDGFDSAGMKAV